VNAVAALVSKYLPAFAPHLSYYEEGSRPTSVLMVLPVTADSFRILNQASDLYFIKEGLSFEQLLDRHTMFPCFMSGIRFSATRYDPAFSISAAY
jgi:hypothetical protein